MTTRKYAWDDPSISSSKMKKLGLGVVSTKPVSNPVAVTSNTPASPAEFKEFLVKAHVISTRLRNEHGSPSTWPVELRDAVTPLAKKYPATTIKKELDNAIESLDRIERKWHKDARMTPMSTSEPKKEGSHQNAYFGEVQKHRDAGEPEDTARAHTDEAMKAKK